MQLNKHELFQIEKYVYKFVYKCVCVCVWECVCLYAEIYNYVKQCSIKETPSTVFVRTSKAKGETNKTFIQSDRKARSSLLLLSIKYRTLSYVYQVRHAQLQIKKK